jgi:non-canonical poly(A) RNA polymerase PAPD5/7
MVYDSDIDITVIMNKGDVRDDDKATVNNILNQISDEIYKSKLIMGSIIHVKKAKTPILKCTEKTGKYKIDISISKKDGLCTADFIKEQLSLRPDMKYFIIILKYYLKCRRLSDTAAGGLCAYAQFLMILSFFQLHPLLQSDSLNIKDILAVLFMDFFQFYGSDFPFDKTGISIGETKYIPNNGSYVYIEDPVVEGNNVAGGCTSIGLIKDLFNYSYKIMAAALSMQIDPSKSVVELWLRSNKNKHKGEQNEILILQSNIFLKKISN